MRIVGALCVGSACMMAGWLFGHQLKERLSYLMEWKRLIIIMRECMRYSRMEFSDVLSEMLLRCEKEEIRDFLEYIREGIRKRQGVRLSELWSRGIHFWLSKTPCKPSDLEELSRLGDCLGCMEQELQIRQMDLFLQRNEQTMDEILRALPEKMKLCHVLGIVSGLTVMILVL